MKTELVAEAKSELVRAMAAPQSQAIKIASDPGVLDATSRQVGNDSHAQGRQKRGAGFVADLENTWKPRWPAAGGPPRT